ncbi:MAG TPA: hypothetical protein VGT42_07135 [Gammaproteobacteria bacterium]|nr:hypothetical protein [Gammaproteobacteria bacterium]
MRSEHGVTECQWCRGDGKDHATLGLPQVRDCPRCRGSGRVYVTSRESAMGRRRVYQGPAPKPGIVAARQQQELTEALQKAKPTRARTKAKTKMRSKPKHGQRHAA